MYLRQKTFTALALISTFISGAHATIRHNNVGFEANLYPSSSPLSQKYDSAALASLKKLQLHASTRIESITALQLALKHKNTAWHVAENIINGIASKTMNSQTLAQYGTPYFQSMVQHHPEAAEVVMHTIEKLGPKAKLSSDYHKGYTSDYMILQKRFDRKKMAMVVIDVIGKIPYSQISKTHPFKYIAVSLLSNKAPYDVWKVGGINLFVGWKFPISTGFIPNPA